MDPKISDNQITWDNPELLSQGFTVVGQDHRGIAQTSKWLIFFIILLTIAALIIYLMREHELVKPRLMSIKAKIVNLKNIAMLKFAGPLSTLDFASQSNRRARRARRLANTNSSQIKPLRQKLSSWKQNRQVDPWMESEETYAEQQENSDSANRDIKLLTTEIEATEVAQKIEKDSSEIENQNALALDTDKNKGRE